MVSEEALVAADKISDNLGIPKESSLFNTLVIECGRKFKPFLEHDDEMGLQARQKLLHGMIERTTFGFSYFHSISQDFIKDIQIKNSALFDVLQSLSQSGALNLNDLAQRIYSKSKVDGMFLYGSWMDPNGSFLHLHGLRDVMENLMYIRQCSFVDRLSDIYKIHKPSEKTSAEQQKEAVFETLHDKKPEEATLFLIHMQNLEKTHPHLADHLLKRFYFMAIQDDEYDAVFDPSQVLTKDQSQQLEHMTTVFNKQWEHHPIVRLLVQRWSSDVAGRALHIMQGMGQDETLMVDVEVQQLDKDKIQER